MNFDWERISDVLFDNKRKKLSWLLNVTAASAVTLAPRTWCRNLCTSRITCSSSEFFIIERWAFLNHSEAFVQNYVCKSYDIKYIRPISSMAEDLCENSWINRLRCRYNDLRTPSCIISWHRVIIHLVVFSSVFVDFMFCNSYCRL